MVLNRVLGDAGNKYPEISERVKIFEKPFAYIVMTYRVKQFCSYCMQRPQNLEKKLQFCAKCRFAQYCDKSCQRKAWKDHHKSECTRLQKVFPHLPLTEVLFLSRIVDKLKFIRDNGDVHHWQEDRKFDDLLSHCDDMLKHEAKMQHFEKMWTKYQCFAGEDVWLDREQFFAIFGRTSINSHSIHDSSGTEIGMALDFGISFYDHSCRPNASLVFDGFRAMVRPLVPQLFAADYRKAFISYIDVGRSRYQRRKDLATKWYFECRCERCSDPEDDRLTAIKCSNPACLAAIIITEETEPMSICCSECKSVVEENDVVRSTKLMLELPAQFCLTSDAENVAYLKQKLSEAKDLLHPENVYFCRLLAACMQIPETGVKFSVDMHKQVYQNYRMCLPAMDRHVGFELLHMVKNLIESDNLEEATSYAYEAMTIFEVSFGMEHPYYLQTLALWTYLDTKANKPKQELLALLNFSSNKLIDIRPFLENE